MERFLNVSYFKGVTLSGRTKVLTKIGLRIH